MAKFVAFLRGMNLGKRRIKNEELCAIVGMMGFSDVSAFLASGNIVFATNKRAVPALEKALRSAFEKHLDYKVPTFVRTATQIEALAQAAPFSQRQLKGTDGNIQVILLATPLTAAKKKAALELAPSEDQLAFDRTEMFWLPQHGLSDSKMKMSALEKVVGPMTVRTQRTFERLSVRLGD